MLPTHNLVVSTYYSLLTAHVLVMLVQEYTNFELGIVVIGIHKPPCVEISIDFDGL